MNVKIKNNIELINDWLSNKSTNICRLEELIYQGGDVIFHCPNCNYKVDNTCMIPRFDLKVK